MAIIYQCDQCGRKMGTRDQGWDYSWALYPAAESKYRPPMPGYEDLRFCCTECLVTYSQQLNASGTQPEDCLKSE